MPGGEYTMSVEWDPQAMAHALEEDVFLDVIDTIPVAPPSSM